MGRRGKEKGREEGGKKRGRGGNWKEREGEGNGAMMEFRGLPG